MDIYIKWGVVMDALKVTDEKVRKFMAEYAEHHQQLDNLILTTISFEKPIVPWGGEGCIHFIDENEQSKLIMPDGWENKGEFFDYADIGQNLLPVSLKALSMIKLEGKNVQLKANLPTKSFSFLLDNDWIIEYKSRTGNSWIQKVEGILINYLTDSINKELETHDNLYIDSMVNMISLRNDGTIETPKPVMYLYSRYHVE